MKNIYLQILTAVLISSLCLLIALSIWGIIKLPILESIIFKDIATTFATIGFVLYIYLLLKKRAKRVHIVGFSLIFEAIGYWWLNSWIGYVFIILGFGLLVLSFFWGKVNCALSKLAPCNWRKYGQRRIKLKDGNLKEKRGTATV